MPEWIFMEYTDFKEFKINIIHRIECDKAIDKRYTNNKFQMQFISFSQSILLLYPLTNKKYEKLKNKTY